MAHDFDRLDSLMKRYVHPLYAIRDRVRGYEVSVMKVAMEVLGMAAGPVRPPLQNCRPQDIADIKSLVDIYREWIDLRVARA
jgi:5-dehydro-4-deoxyglucarate dehydratase